MIKSFDAHYSQHMHTLILGSIPSIASLNQRQYYAHPRNAFWPIILSKLTQKTVSYDLAQQLDYSERVHLLLDAGYGLWDVIATCQRDGSLDSSIKNSTVEVNDFQSLLQQHSNLNRLIFNGQKARQLFDQYIKRQHKTKSKTPDSTPAWLQQVDLMTLPSTSPAMASLTLTEKAQRWHAVL